MRPSSARVTPRITPVACAAIAFATVVGSATAMAQDAPEQSEAGPTRICWVFLERTKVAGPADQATGEKMQADHIGNLKRLWDLHKALTAGPLQDKGGTKRGIVILTVTDANAVRHCFDPDPYVQTGIFTLHAIPMSAKFGHIARPPLNARMAENRLVVLEKTDLRANRRDLAAHWAHVSRDGVPAGLAYYAAAGPRTRDAIQEIALFRGKDDAAVTAWLDADPLVKAGALKPVVYPQYLMDGILGG